MGLKAQKSALVALRQRYTQDLSDVRNRLNQIGRSDRVQIPEDLPSQESGVETALFERERDMAFEHEYISTLKMIDLALQRIEEGTYTKCMRCGNEVGAERQTALPYAILCIRDQELEERI